MTETRQMIEAARAEATRIHRAGMIGCPYCPKKQPKQYRAFRKQENVEANKGE
jgi:hypothetical protein